MITVASVLRSGGPYTPGHVRRLYEGLERNSSRQFRFVCLPHAEVPGIERIPLVHRWRGWWSKIELFRPGVFEDGGRVLYIDLDTVITGDVSGLMAREEPLIVLADFYRQPPRSPIARYGSGLMAWTGGLHTQIYAWFAKNPIGLMGGMQALGDQGWIERSAPGARFWQDLVPGQVVSYKVHCRMSKQLPEGAKVVCFHGSPKPWDRDVMRQHSWVA